MDPEEILIGGSGSPLARVATWADSIAWFKAKSTGNNGFTGIYMGALLCKCSNHPILVVLVWFEMEAVGCRAPWIHQKCFFCGNKCDCFSTCWKLPCKGGHSLRLACAGPRSGGQTSQTSQNCSCLIFWETPMSSKGSTYTIYIHTIIYLSIYLFIHLFVYLFVYLLIYLFMCLFVYLLNLFPKHRSNVLGFLGFDQLRHQSNYPHHRWHHRRSPESCLSHAGD